jgi:hypothetical protein
LWNTTSREHRAVTPHNWRRAFLLHLPFDRRRKVGEAQVINNVEDVAPEDDDRDEEESDAIADISNHGSPRRIPSRTASSMRPVTPENRWCPCAFFRVRAPRSPSSHVRSSCRRTSKTQRKVAIADEVEVAPWSLMRYGRRFLVSPRCMSKLFSRF